MGFIDWFNRTFIQPAEGRPGKKIGPQLLILLGVGVGLLVFNSLFSFGRREPGPPVPEPAAREEIFGEEEPGLQALAAVLDQVRGVSNARIYLTAASTGRLELGTDRESSVRRTAEGESESVVLEETRRETHVILRDAQGRETPLVLEEKMPSYRGVLVVADGVGDPSVKAQVVEALRALLDLPYHRITVLPAK